MHNLLVTGAAGFIGSHFARKATNKGLNVVALDKLSYAGHRQNISDLENQPNFTFYEGDISDGGAVGDILNSHKIDWLINFAAESHVDRSIEAPLAFVENNTVGTCVLLSEFYAHWSRHGKDGTMLFVQVSTDEVYGSCREGSLFTESSCYDPSSPYSASKAAADHFVTAYNRTFGLPTLITNCSNNYGPYQYPEKLIPTIILRAKERLSLPIYGDGKNVRDWIYVGDHCNAILHLLDKAPTGETFLIGASSEVNNIDLVNSLCKILDLKLPSGAPHHDLIEFVQDRPGHDKRYAIDWSKLKSTGWQPVISLRSGLLRTVDWYLNNTDWIATLSNNPHRTRRGIT